MGSGARARISAKKVRGRGRARRRAMRGAWRHLLYLLEVHVEGLRAEGVTDTDGDEELGELVQDRARVRVRVKVRVRVRVRVSCRSAAGVQ